MFRAFQLLPVADVVPLAAGMAPTLLVVAGAPGSGKTTVARGIAADWYQDGRNHFVDVDYDDAINFHPQGPALFRLRDAVTDRPLPIGSPDTFFLCRNQAIEVMRAVVRDTLLVERPRHSVILYRNHTAPEVLAAAKRLGWRTALLFVGVPREVAVRRAHDRGPRQGRFFDADDVGYWYDIVQAGVAWWALLADTWLVADNHRDGQPPRVTTVDPHDAGADWTATVRRMQALVDGVAPPGPTPRENARRDRELVAGHPPTTTP